MYLDFIWISKFLGIENQSFQFSCKYSYTYDDKTNILTRTENEENSKFIDYFFGEKIEVNAVIGKNGCGKTSLMKAVYACIEGNLSISGERILLVFRDGSIFYSPYSEWQKFEQGQKELEVKWKRNWYNRIPNLRCIYYTNALDYQYNEYNNTSEITTNLSLSYLLNEYLNSSHTYGLGNFTSRTLEGFFYCEIKKQIALLRKIPESKINELNLPFPQFCRIRLKEDYLLIKDLYNEFGFIEDNLDQLIIKFNDNLCIEDNLFERFYNNLSLCILTSILYSVFFLIDLDSDILGSADLKDFITFNNSNYFYSIFSKEKRAFIAIDILIYLIDDLKKLRYNNTQYNSWSLICELINYIIILSSPHETFINEFVGNYGEKIHKNLYEKYYSQANKQTEDYEVYKSFQSFENELGKDLDLEIKYDLRMFADSASSLNRLLFYISSIRTNSDIIYKSNTELWISLSNNKNENISMMTEIWKRYQSIGFMYQYMYFSWNLSSGEYERWAMFSKIYYYVEKLNLVSQNLLIIFDEADMLLHPEWQQNYVKHIVDFMKMMFSDIRVQIIIATHSPIMLSDIPRQNTLLLERDSETGIILSPDSEETFAANIFSLYQNSFFITDTGIGSFAKKRLADLVSDIHETDESKFSYSNEELLQQIDAVGDVYLRAKLRQEFFMYRDADNKTKEYEKVTKMRSELRKKDEELTKIKKELEELKKKHGGINR